LTAPENGRVTIPAQVRRAAHIEPGQPLVMYVEDGRVVIETREQLVERTKRDFAANSSGADLVGELAAERRAEAAREAGE
jgi:AbrB family looped-hinge helix DNA binding protein